MVIYELSHLFFRYEDEPVYSPKSLGIYHSYENALQAVRYYNNQPGFCDNRDAFSIKERLVLGDVVNDTVYEVMIYLHSEDYEFEAAVELGLYGEAISAQDKLDKYCRENAALINAPTLILEKIINKLIIDRREWPEGFLVSE